MISLDLFGDPIKNKKELLWQLRSSWVGKDLLTVPVSLHIGVGVAIPSNFGKRKKKEALNHLIKPIDKFNVFKAIENYSYLIENVIISNRNQIYKISFEKFYSSNPKVRMYLVPQIDESFSGPTEGVL